MKSLIEKIKRTFGYLWSHPLGKRHPLIILKRMLGWQLQNFAFPKKLKVKKFIGPVKFYARKGLTGITGNIYTGLHDFDEMTFVMHFLREKDNFLDIGANVGSYTLLASGISKAQTIAIEPVESTFELLTNNILLNGLSERVTLIKAIAGSSASVAAFTQATDTLNHVLFEGEPNIDVVELPVISIDSLPIKDVPLLVKIDVEGYEAEVLKGMSTTLSAPFLKVIIIELNGSGERYGFDENKIHELLISKGFQAYCYDPFTRMLRKLDNFGKLNTIYVRDLAFVNDRLQTADPFFIMGEKI